MMKYERLTDKQCRFKKCVNCKYGQCQYCDDYIDYENEVYDRLAELEDDLESGKIIRLPCEVGDIVAYKENNEYYVHRYIGNLKFECLSHPQGYNCDYILIGKLICGDDTIAILDRKANKGNSIQFKPFKHIERAEAKLKELQE